jgi:hypothetical protein
MSERSLDWLRQGEKDDIEKAKLYLKEGYYEWACFTSQQAAEKAIKTVFQRLHGEAWGRGTKALLENLPYEDSSQLIEDAKLLGRQVPRKPRFQAGSRGTLETIFPFREAAACGRGASQFLYSDPVSQWSPRGHSA